MTPDVGVAKQFHGGLFGWHVGDGPVGSNHAEASVDGRPVAGLTTGA